MRIVALMAGITGILAVGLAVQSLADGRVVLFFVNAIVAVVCVVIMETNLRMVR